MKVGMMLKHNSSNFGIMSDTENKKSVKGTENLGGKKRAAAAAAAAAANKVATPSTDLLDTTEDTTNSSPKNKKHKHERKTEETPMNTTTTTTTDADDETADDEKVDENHLDHNTMNIDPVVPATVPVVGDNKTDLLTSAPMITETVLTMCPAARKLSSNVVSFVKGPPDALATVSSAESFVLVMITNDVEYTSKMNKERESAFTAVNFVTVKVLEAGFNSAPYEKVEGNAKNLVYCDKKGKLLEGRPTKLVTIASVDGVKYLDMKTWEQHPCSMMKTKWRGLPTDVLA
jgi:hypothetical protein